MPVHPYMAVGLGVVAVSFSSIFTKLSGAPPIVIAFYRIGLAALILLPFAMRGRPFAEITRIRRRDLAFALASGVLLALHFTVWITSLRYTSIASSTVLVTMQPLFVVAGGFLILKERVAAPALCAGGLALSGSVLVGVSDFQIGGQALYGDLLAFAGAAFVAGYFLIGRRLRARMTVVAYTFLVYGAAALTLGAFCLLTATPLYPYPGVEWVYFASLALIPTMLGHSVFNWALRYVGAALVSVSILGEPVGATILAYFIFAEKPAGLQILGGAIIIAGIALFLAASGGKKGAPAVITSCKQEIV